MSLDRDLRLRRVPGARRALRLDVAAVAIVACAAVSAPRAAAPCTSFEVEGLKPGMTLSEVRRVMDGKEDKLEVAALPDGFETTAEFSRGHLRIAAVFPERVNPRSKTGLSAVRSCASSSVRAPAAFAEQVRAQFGEPASGGADLDNGLRHGPALWASPECQVEVRAFREEPWWDPAAEASCVEVRIARETVAPPPMIAISEPAVEIAAATPAAAEDTASPGPEPAPEGGERTREPDPGPSVAVEARLPVDPLPPVPAGEPPSRPAVDGAIAADSEVETSRPDAEPVDDFALEVRPSATAPRLIRSTQAQYPPQLRGRGIPTRVVVQAKVLPDGSVGDVVVTECNRPGLGFESRVVAAVRKWRYEPARQGEVAVTAEILIPFVFE